ncbi:DUF4357 domain-containing protein [Aquabacter sediminis]|uniref:DUF4357 domain-containing protein n=1 Tax=Aquabacter sediminis TaxID=3029197 RepID=UPI00237DFCC8|nr:DUF4357 domain-containing protein [Aquabacter sp. P-9]MDE1570945.1 DUF4357 domain-containing protein [Aquabacter sp. P-9]
MIQMARDAGRVSLDNGQAPDSERRRLPEADKADMEAFLSNLLAILPVVGLDLFKPRPRQVVTQGGISRTFDLVRMDGRVKDGGTPKFKISGDKVYATAFVVDEEFTIIKGSKSLVNGAYTEAINSQNPALMKIGYARLKKFLIDENVLVASDTGLIFSRDFQFRSPSAASSVVLDRNSNGRTEWVEENTNLTYHEWQNKLTVVEEAVDVDLEDNGVISDGIS